jgi:hypothetical protein
MQTAIAIAAKTFGLGFLLVFASCHNTEPGSSDQAADLGEVALGVSDEQLQTLVGKESARYAKRPCQKLDVVEPVSLKDAHQYWDGGSRDLTLADAKGTEYTFKIWHKVEGPMDITRSSRKGDTERVEFAGPEEQDLYGIILRWILAHPRRDALLGKSDINPGKDPTLHEACQFYFRMRYRIVERKIRRYDPVVEAILKDDGAVVYNDQLDVMRSLLPEGAQLPQGDDPDGVFQADVKYDATLARLEQLPNLQSLTLGVYVGTGAPPSLTNEGLSHLRALTKLRRLKIGSTSITDAGLANLSSLHRLEILELGELPTTDASLEHLQGLTQLQKLYIGSGWKVTDAGLAYLKGLTQLRTLVLNGGDRITDTGLEHLTGLTQLRELDLSSTRVTDEGLERLRSFPQLQTLNLTSTPTTDAGLEHLSGLTQLRDLNLSGTVITDAGMERLKGLTHLRIDGCRKLTAEGRKKFQAAWPNCRVD